MKEIKIGDRVQCIEYMIFADGSEHNVGDIITVTEENIYYYQYWIDKYYILIEN